MAEQFITLLYRDDENDAWVEVHMSRTPPGLKRDRWFTSLDAAKTWFLHQGRFSRMPGCLSCSYIVRDERRAVFEHFSYSLDDWLAGRAAEHNIDAEGWDQHKRDRWYTLIRGEFIAIFGAITKALRSIHSHGMYHGNLRDGIALKNDSAALYNMREVGGQTVRESQLADYEDLVRIILCVVNHPLFRVAWGDDMQGMEALWNLESRGLRTHIEEVDDFFLVQLTGILDSSIEPRWATHPALFWEMEEEVEFLRGMHSILFERSNYMKFWSKIDHYFNTRWRDHIQSPNGSPLLKKLLSFHVQHNRDDPYTEGMCQIPFWRNAIAHAKVRLNPLVRQSSVEIIHRLVLREVNGCLRESLRAMNCLAQTSNPILLHFAQLICNEMKLKDSVQV